MVEAWIYGRSDTIPSHQSESERLTANGLCSTTSPASYEVTNHLLPKVLEYSRGPSANSPVESMFWLKALRESSSLRPLSFAFLVKSASTCLPSVCPREVSDYGLSPPLSYSPFSKYIKPPPVRLISPMGTQAVTLVGSPCRRNI
jgi:hypothetical protein